MNLIPRQLAWAWLIIIGGLMIYPGGIACIACGSRTIDLGMGVISIAIGAIGFYTASQR